MNELLSGATESFFFIIPELVLVAGIIAVLLTGLFNSHNNTVLLGLTLLTALGSLTIILMCGTKGSQELFDSMLLRDGFADFFMLLVDASVIITCLLSIRPADHRHLSEYYALILSIAVGSHLLLMSSNLLMLFLSLELISISSYVLAGYAFNRSATEGTLKYFIYGSVTSAIMLYGFSILYGLAGTLDFNSELFFDRLVDTRSPLVLLAGLMALAGLLFKMAAVPMQMWAPDVYEAAPIPVIAFLSVAPKLAAVGILIKFVLAINLFGQGMFDWQLIVAGIAILTITVGNLSALGQTNVKRMMAYSSIAHSGFLLVPIAAFTPEAARFMLFYAGVYMLMNFCVFAYLLAFEKNGLLSMNAFSGKGKDLVWPLVGVTVGLVALTGLPPTAGFTAKLFIFSALWESYQQTHKSLLFWLLVIGLINTVISLFFYLRIPYYAFIRPVEASETEKKGGFENLLGFILVVIVVVIFFIPGLLMGLINRINFVF